MFFKYKWELVKMYISDHHLLKLWFNRFSSESGPWHALQSTWLLLASAASSLPVPLCTLPSTQTLQSLWHVCIMFHLLRPINSSITLNTSWRNSLSSLLCVPVQLCITKLTEPLMCSDFLIYLPWRGRAMSHLPYLFPALSTLPST